jgi:hypothetical protein
MSGGVAQALLPVPKANSSYLVAPCANKSRFAGSQTSQTDAAACHVSASTYLSVAVKLENPKSPITPVAPAR